MPKLRLSELAHGRSGDKGNHANIAILADTEAGYTLLKHVLTADYVRNLFAPVGLTQVERYEADNVRGLNFVLFNSLGGGASRSLRTDTQGKTFAVTLLQQFIDVPDDLVPFVVRDRHE